MHQRLNINIVKDYNDIIRLAFEAWKIEGGYHG